MITQIKRRLHRFWLIMSAVFFFISCGSAYCFNVSPARIEISVAASKSYEQILTVKNTDKATMNMKLWIEDWHKAVEGVKEEKAAEFRWLEITPLEFELGAGEAKQVSLKVDVPKKAKGEFNAMIFIEGRPKVAQEGAVTINTSIGIPIYVMVKGTERFKAEVEDLTVTKNTPLEMAIKIKNTGNVHIRPQGVITIKNKKGKELFNVPLNEYNYPVLPDSSRTLEIKSNNRLENGEYTADVKMGFNDRKHRKKIKLNVQ